MLRAAAHSARGAARVVAVMSRAHHGSGRTTRRPRDADHRHRRRPAGGALRPGVLRARHGQEHLRHRLLPADEHRAAPARVGQPAAHDDRVGDRHAALRARRRRVRRRRRRAVAARRARVHRSLRADRSAGRKRARHRRRVSRARVHRPRQPALGRVRARHDARASRAAPRARTSRGPRSRRIAFQSAEVLQAMQKDARQPLRELRVDGGATSQRPADAVPGGPARRAGRPSRVTETTALGAAYLAGSGRRLLGLARRSGGQLARGAHVRAGDATRRGRARAWHAGRRPSTASRDWHPRD